MGQNNNTSTPKSAVAQVESVEQKLGQAEHYALTPPIVTNWLTTTFLGGAKIHETNFSSFSKVFVVHIVKHVYAD